MKSYKVTLQRDSTEPVDLLLSVEPGVTVGDLAEAITIRGNTKVDGYGLWTLAVTGPDHAVTLTRSDPVDRAGLHSGMTISVVPASDHYPRSHADGRAARLTIEAGPDRGIAPVWLPSGTSTIGRDPGCTVVLADAQATKIHARINVTDVVEIVDNNSTNGTYVGGVPVNRARLRHGETAQLGDTVISVSMQEDSAGMAAARPSGTASPKTYAHFNRSPRLDPPYPGRRFEAPEPPKRPQARHFPIIAMVAPLLVGGALFLFTGSILSLMFIALSPLMLVGTYAEGSVTDRRSLRAATAAFREAVATLNVDLRAEADAERAHRRREHPSTRELVDAGNRMHPLLWTRRPEHASFLQMRLGLGRLPTRSSVEMPGHTDVIPELWSELTTIVDAYATVDAVPVVADLRESGALGIAGYSRSAVPVAWSVIAQLVTLHSPAEVVLTAVTSSTSARDWRWLTWLPHTSVAPVSPHTPLRGPHLTADAATSNALTAEIDELITERAKRAKTGSAAITLPLVVLLVEDDADADRGRLVDIAERGPACGVHVIWISSTVEKLPAVCRTFVDVNPATGAGPVGFVHRGDGVDPVALEPLSHTDVDMLARHLSPLIDIGARVNDDTDLPRSAAFLDLAEAPLDSSISEVIDRWRESGSLPGATAKVAPGLRALIGVRGLDAASGPEPMHLDLRRDGPHALVGGTTGAGKSELLQSWILGMATATSPLRVTFLFVDYKGGAAFGACRNLPHSVGIVTDLSLRQVHRALTSLRAEVTYREHVLNEHGAKDLAELEQSRADVAPPRLVIVVDEFAALRSEVPEFVDGVVDVAQRGRSLGLHLILATQRPAGIITDSLRANTNLRIALRMADDADSVDVLGSKIAAGFDPGIPGRAVAKTGPGRLMTFQAAYAGGWSNGVPPRPLIVIETLGFSRGRVWADPTPPVHIPVSERGPNDVARIVATMRAASDAIGLSEPRIPWQPELPVVIELGSFLDRVGRETTDLGRYIGADGTESQVERTWSTARPLPFGRRDVPKLQITPPVAFYPDRDGNLAVYGTGGTGKSTLLRTIALTAILDEGQPTHVYGIEFGGRGLSVLAPLPEVGALVRGDEAAHVTRLMRHLRGIIARRQAIFAGCHAGTMAEYWHRTGDRAETRILLLIDGMGAFYQQYQPGAAGGIFEHLLSIATDGRPVGVHVIVSADRGNAVPNSLTSALQQRIVLRMAGENDYGMVGLRADAIPSGAPPGRGLYGTEDVQVAIYGGADQVAQHDAILQLSRRVRTVAPAPRVEVVSADVRLSALPAPTQDEPILGQSDAMETVTFRPRGTFVVTGPAESGRTTTLRTLIHSLRTWRPGCRLYYVGGKEGTAIGALDGWVDHAAGLTDAAALALKTTGSALITAPDEPVVVIVESMEKLFGPSSGAGDDEAQRAVLGMLDMFVSRGHLVVFEGDPAVLARPLLALARDRGTGLLLRPTLDHAGAFSVPFPRGVQQNEFPAGRGFLYEQGGAPRLVQVAQIG